MEVDEQVFLVFEKSMRKTTFVQETICGREKEEKKT